MWPDTPAKATGDITFAGGGHHAVCIAGDRALNRVHRWRWASHRVHRWRWAPNRVHRWRWASYSVHRWRWAMSGRNRQRFQESCSCRQRLRPRTRIQVLLPQRAPRPRRSRGTHCYWCQHCHWHWPAGVRRGTSLVPVPVVRQARGSNRQARGNRQRQPTGARQQHRRTRGGTSLTVRGNRRAHGNTTGHWPARHYQSVIRRERTDVRDCWFSVL